MAARGSRMILSSRKGPELDELAESLPGEGHQTIVTDLADEGAALQLVAEAGEIDVLVANAGLPASGRLDGFSPDEVGRALRGNLESPVRMTGELLPGWQERDSGHFVYVSSTSGFIATPRASLYAATKFGLRGFALNLREDLRHTGIGVSVITPGAIRDAGMFAESGAADPPGVGTGSPEGVAKAVITSIERDRGEISVGTRRQRFLARFAMIAPELSGRVSSGTATRVADEIAQGQTEKR